MNKSGFFTRTFGAGIALLIITGTVADIPAQDAASQTAVVTSVKGKARFSTNQKTWNTLKEGEVISPGNLIQTAAKTTVDIKLGETGNLVRLFDESVLGIDKLDPDNTQLDLRAGQIAGNVKKPSSADAKYEIKFESGVAGIREGVFQISSKGGLSMREGSAVIASSPAGGAMTTQVVNAGQHFDARTGKVTTISQAETDRTSKLDREPPPNQKRKTPTGPQVRPGI